MSIRAITLDLDDTLWPIAPVIRRALDELDRWFAHHAPRIAADYTSDHWNRWRIAVEAEHPDRAHDFSFLRQRTIEQALAAEGYDPALAKAAFDVFFEARHRVELFEDVIEALGRLSRHYPVAALTNGTAEPDRLSIGHYFSFTLHARSVSAPKPAAVIFEAAAERFELDPEHLLHVGDSLAEDVHGALGAGWQAAWLVRYGRPSDADVPTFRNLIELADHLDRVDGRIGAE